MATALEKELFKITCDHLNGNMGVTQKIKRAMEETAKQFVYIGFLLWEVKEYQYYYENGYGSVYEYAEAELGFKRSSTKNFIAICEQFCRKSEYKLPTMFLDERWNDYSYSQLTEMLSMSAAKREQATPSMTVKQIRELKKLPEDPKQISTDVPETQATGQTSGRYNIQVHDASKPYTGPDLRTAGLSIDSGFHAALKQETLENLCEIACIKFNKNGRYHIAIYEEIPSQSR